MSKRTKLNNAVVDSRTTIIMDSTLSKDTLYAWLPDEVITSEQVDQLMAQVYKNKAKLKALEDSPTEVCELCLAHHLESKDED